METLLWISIALITYGLIRRIHSRAVLQFLRIWSLLLLILLTLTFFDDELYFNWFIHPDEESITYFTKQLNKEEGEIENIEILSVEESVEYPMAYQVNVRYEIKGRATCRGELLLTYKERTWLAERNKIPECYPHHTI